MVTETKNEIVFDGGGNPVIKKNGYQNYHAVTGTPPPTNWQPPVRSYQVWSTVLGGSLMKYHPANDYRETKVYAGGAVIAEKTRGVENNQTVEHTGWKTSDPVTGTQAVFNQYGAVKLEEKEPLGQSIYQHDPEDPAQPLPSDPLGNADYPQWQCQVPDRFYGGFFGIPVHCMLPRMMTDEYNLYVGRLEPWFGNSTNTSSFRGNSFASMSASNPNSINGIYDEERQYSTDNFNDASWYGDDIYARNPARRLKDDEIDTLRKSIERNVDSDCQKYIALLINTVAANLGKTAVSTNIFTLFDRVRKANGANRSGIYNSGFWGFLVPSTSTASAYWENNNASVGLAISNHIYDRWGAIGIRLTKEEFNNLSESERQSSYDISSIDFLTSSYSAIVTVHELIHNAIRESGTGAGDVELAEAALQLEGKRLDLSGVPIKDRWEIGSAIWDNRLRVACGFEPINEEKLKKYIK